ncbi:zinc ribbon domain-containing protein [Parabacteroides goldsteinii]
MRNPLDINQEELLGTNGDQTKCDEYRVYCYQNGRFK